MVDSQESQKVATQQMQNYDYIQYRLDNQNVIRKFEDTLSGVHREIYWDETIQKGVEKVEQIGTPLINKEGHRAIVGYFSLLANSSVVQGNTKEEQLNKELKYISKHLSKLLAANGKLWDCSDTRRLIHSQFIDHINLYLTRTIDNLERDSYLNLKQTETTTIKQDNKKIGGFI